MTDDITRRVARYERALIGIAARKPEGETLTAADHVRAVQVAAMVERYEAGLRSPVKADEEPEARSGAPAPARRARKRRRRKPVAAAATPKRRGRPPKVRPPEGEPMGQ